MQCLSAQKYQCSTCTAPGGAKMTQAGTQSLQAEHWLILEVLREPSTVPGSCSGGCRHCSETPLSLISVSQMAKPSPPKALSKNNQAEADTGCGKF